MSVIADPTNGQATPITSTDSAFGLALKYARTYIDGSAIRAKYDIFDKTPLEYGGIIENIRVPATESTADNPTANDLLPAKYPTLNVRYFADWTGKRFDTEVRDSNLEAVVNDGSAMAQLVANIVNANNEGERKEANAAYNKLFVKATASDVVGNSLLVVFTTADTIASALHKGAQYGTSYLYASKQYEILDLSAATTDEAKAQTILKEIQRVSKDMTFDNGIYSGNFVCGADLSDLVVIMPSDFMASLNVDFLAHVRNLERVEIPQIVETNTNSISLSGSGPSKMHIAYVLDKRAIGRVWKGKKAYDWFNGIRLSRMITTRLDEMYYYHPAYKAYAIVW